MSKELLPYRVLFVEDERQTRENYVIYLKTIFKEVYEAEDGDDGYRQYVDKKPHIMVIDLNLPKMNGLELLKRIRQADHNTKAIMLTAHTDKEFLLSAASLKLVEYLVKPVNRRDLKNALNIAVEELEHFKIEAVKKVVFASGYSWDKESKELLHHKENIQLTAKETKMLELLCSSLGRTFTYDEISEYVWGYDALGSADSIKTLVKKLRTKLPKSTVENVFGIGYKINSLK